MFSSFDGRKVVVTGASRGIGKGIARILGRAGASVLLVGRDEIDGAQAAQEVSAEGSPNASFLSVDLTSRTECQRMADIAMDRLGGIDVLCANAGIFPEKRLVDMTDDDFNMVFDANVRSAFWSVQSCTDALARSDAGRVVLTSSITGPITGFPGWSHYGASKAAQLGFMRTAALELAPLGITINAVLPGNVLTEGLVAMGDKYLDSMRSSVPLHELGSVEDVGYAVLYLASREASFVTGQTIVVDGGQVLPESINAISVK